MSVTEVDTMDGNNIGIVISLCVLLYVGYVPLCGILYEKVKVHPLGILLTAISASALVGFLLAKFGG